MKPKGSQEPITRLYPEPDESSSLILHDTVKYYRLIYFQVSMLRTFADNILYKFLILFMCATCPPPPLRLILGTITVGLTLIIVHVILCKLYKNIYPLQCPRFHCVWSGCWATIMDIFSNVYKTI
jgi:hypothetical protein